MNRRPVGVLLIRGGLGNQLFQVAALSYFSDKLGFLPVLFDQRINRNNGFGSSRELHRLRCSDWFQCEPIIKPNFFLRLALRLILKFNNKLFFCPVLNEGHLNSFGKEITTPLFFVQDYFQRKDYALQIPPEVLVKSLTTKVSHISVRTGNEFRCLMHLRLTDSHDRSDKLLNKSLLSNIIEDVHNRSRNTPFDLISDDPKFATNFLREICFNLEFTNLESDYVYPAAELLSLFANYKFVLSSKSTLCWWGCLLLTNIEGKEPIIYSLFDEGLNLSEWIDAKSYFRS